MLATHLYFSYSPHEIAHLRGKKFYQNLYLTKVFLREGRLLNLYRWKMTLLHFTFVISLPNCNQKLKLCQCTARVPELFTSKEIELSSIAKSNLSFQVCILCKSPPYFRSVLAYYSLWNNSMFAHNLHDTRMQLLQPLVPFPSFSNQTNDFLRLFITWKGILPSTQISRRGLLLPSVSPSDNSHESQFTTGIP